jgi:hypothetical protein
MLHIFTLGPMPSCSKAPRGLFVLLRVARIFTGPSISSSLWLRQRSSRYAFPAGRNLPDKGFRYLRTVIVTAAVHRGFSLKLCFDCSKRTSPFNLPALGRRQPLYIALRLKQGPMFLLNSRQSLCFESPSRFPPKVIRRPQWSSPLRAPLLPKLRGQFAEFLNHSSLVRLSALTPAYQCRFAVRTPFSITTRLFLPV